MPARRALEAACETQTAAVQHAGPPFAPWGDARRRSGGRCRPKKDAESRGWRSPPLARHGCNHSSNTRVVPSSRGRTAATGVDRVRWGVLPCAQTNTVPYQERARDRLDDPRQPAARRAARCQSRRIRGRRQASSPECGYPPELGEAFCGPSPLRAALPIRGKLPPAGTGEKCLYEARPRPPGLGRAPAVKRAGCRVPDPGRDASHAAPPFRPPSRRSHEGGQSSWPR